MSPSLPTVPPWENRVFSNTVKPASWIPNRRIRMCSRWEKLRIVSVSPLSLDLSSRVDLTELEKTMRAE